MATNSGGAAAPGDGGAQATGGEGRAGLLARLDGHVHGFELALVTGALLVMSFTYVLKVFHREMNAGVTAFGKVILKIGGYPDIEDAPEAVIEAVSQVWTPLVLGVATFILALLALRTRWVMGVQHAGADAPPQAATGPAPWPRWVVLGVLLTVGIYALLWIVGATPSRWLCLLALAAMVAPAAVASAKTRSWGLLLGVVAGGAAVAAYFALYVDKGYTWSDKLATVGLMYVGFLGASMATRERKHIKVDVVRKMVPLRWLHLYNAISGLATVAFLAFLAVLASVYVWIDVRQDGRIEGLEMLPHSLVSGPVLLAMIIMILRFSGQIWQDLGAWRRGELPGAVTPDVH